MFWEWFWECHVDDGARLIKKYSSLTATVSISVEVDLSEIKNTFTPRVFKRETSEFLAVFDSETCRWPLS